MLKVLGVLLGVSFLFTVSCLGIFRFMEDKEKAGKIVANTLIILHIVVFLCCIFFNDGEGISLNELYPPKP